ncbi:MAG: hypothetical protein ABW202_05465 [Duganella sp.]
MSPAQAQAQAPKTAGKRAAVALPYWISEFGLIRTAVLTAAAVIICGMTLVTVTAIGQQEADEALAQAQRERNAAATRYAQLDNEKRDIRNFQQRYSELRQRGLIGEERRLEWVDAIRQVQESRRLPPLSYEIDPQQPVRLESALDLGEYTLQGSRMRLHMELVQDMDLFDFFADLHERGFFALQDCSIKRLASAVQATATGAATLGADCTLNWITMAPAGKGKP